MNVEIMPMDETVTKPRDCMEERELLLRELSTNLETRDETTPSLNLKDKALQLALKQLPGAYKNDKFFTEILENHSHYEQFFIHKDLIWTTNRVGSKVVCIPDGLYKGKSLQGIVLEACHLTLRHAGGCRTLGYIQQWFWWPSIAKDMESYCESCGKCQMSKGS